MALVLPLNSPFPSTISSICKHLSHSPKNAPMPLYMCVHSSRNKLTNGLFVAFSTKYGKKLTKEKLKILTWIDYQLQEPEEKYLNTSLLKMSKTLKIKKTSLWYRLKSLEEMGCIQKEAKFSRSGGTRLMLSEATTEIFRKFKIYHTDVNLHLSEDMQLSTGRKFVNQEMLAELNEQTGWGLKMTRKLARYLNSAFAQKFKTLDAWRIYLKAKLHNATKITCKIGFLFYLLNFSTIDNVLGAVLKNHATQQQISALEKIREAEFESINLLMKVIPISQ